MTSKDALAEYRRRRDFAKTVEPEGRRGGGPGGRPRFVVQIHDARRLHFDFRLEVEGVLKSWAVPKGPSSDPRQRRFATRTEDHPLEYGDFEGVIPKGEYGGGTVIIWDEGTYRSLATDRRGREIPFAEALRDGHASFWMDGSKLRGGYALTRIRGGPGGDDEGWLLVKRNDERAHSGGAPATPARARSVRTRRSLRQVAAEESAGDSEG
ncbi:DNA polymerase ligase N-terminal domain-containing protein [Streptomyces sp. 6N223]|uniref:DNA polymerase ligase N-terminal domain-containing protein n=1 Tax=Streptomyces sp. 6N223 TaxID=3457412 RepID=UPI003FD4AF4C